MNRLNKFRQLLVRAIAILSIIISLGNTKQVLAAQNVSDISVTIVADQSKVKMGEDITYTVTATNLGPDDAIFIDVGFSLPDQLNLVSLTCDRGISPDTPFCEYSTLAAGETVVSTLVATPTSGSLIYDRKDAVTANIFFEIDCSYDPNCTFDPDLSNNSASLITKLIGKLAHP